MPSNHKNFDIQFRIAHNTYMCSTLIMGNFSHFANPLDDYNKFVSKLVEAVNWHHDPESRTEHLEINQQSSVEYQVLKRFRIEHFGLIMATSLVGVDKLNGFFETFGFISAGDTSNAKNGTRTRLYLIDAKKFMSRLETERERLRIRIEIDKPGLLSDH